MAEVEEIVDAVGIHPERPRVGAHRRRGRLRSLYRRLLVRRRRLWRRHGIVPNCLRRRRRRRRRHHRLLDVRVLRWLHRHRWILVRGDEKKGGNGFGGRGKITTGTTGTAKGKK